MLQITVHETPTSMTFELEGRLAGPWVRQLETFVQRTLATRTRSIVRFDLTGVTLIDDRGKDFLAIMQMEGADLLAGGALMTSVLTALGDPPVPARVHRAQFSHN